MKRIITLIFAVTMTATVLSAQIAPGMKYKELKNIYNSKEYVKSASDPYSTGWAGFASFVVPGLGQVISGETGRGLGIFAGDAAIRLGGSICAINMKKYLETDSKGKIVTDDKGNFIYKDKDKATKWGGAMIGVGIVGVIYNIWNICDAVKVAKVRNMYYQDLSKQHSMELDLYPSLDYAMSASGSQPVAGMTLSLRF